MEEHNTHFTFEQLADYVDGRLPAGEAAQLADHLAGGCTACQEEIGWLQQTTALMAEQWETPTRAVRANVHRAFRHYVPANGESQPAKPQRRPVPIFQRLFQHRLRLVTALILVVFLMFASGRFYQGWAEEVIQNAALLVEISGSAEYLPSGETAWKPLTNNILLDAGDKVRTGEDGSIGLQFFENNITYLGPNTQIELIVYSVRRDGQERVITLEQSTGQIYSSGWPPGTELTYLSVRTPQAVVAVQALGYDVVIDSGGKTEISVINGCAEIVSYDAATHTSHRQQTGSACSGRSSGQDAPIAPDNHLGQIREL
jgi:hypothetical protein